MSGGSGGARTRPWAGKSSVTYLGYALVVLAEWAGHIESLRGVTAGDVNAAIAARAGNAAQGRRTALRSIFRALKQERLIFADRTRGSRLTAVPTLPNTLPGDALRGLIDRADGVMARLAVALVAVHALGVTDLRALRLRDLDATEGRIRHHPRARQRSARLP